MVIAVTTPQYIIEVKKTNCVIINILEGRLEDMPPANNDITTFHQWNKTTILPMIGDLYFHEEDERFVEEVTTQAWQDQEKARRIKEWKLHKREMQSLVASDYYAETASDSYKSKFNTYLVWLDSFDMNTVTYNTHIRYFVPDEW
jgi:hypothetical protein